MWVANLAIGLIIGAALWLIALNTINMYQRERSRKFLYQLINQLNYETAVINRGNRTMISAQLTYLTKGNLEVSTSDVVREENAGVVISRGEKVDVLIPWGRIIELEYTDDGVTESDYLAAIRVQYPWHE